MGTAEAASDDPDEGRRPGDLSDLIQASEELEAFIVWRDDDGAQSILELVEDEGEISLGRTEKADIALTWDELVSRLHCTLAPSAGQWIVEDQGSMNGTFVNQKRIVLPHRLSDCDLIRVGACGITFRQPANDAEEATKMDRERYPLEPLTPSQSKVVQSLCAPVLASPSPDSLASPATNDAIAEELMITKDGVKAHLRAIYAKFAIGKGISGGRKRELLVKRAIQSGVVAPGAD